MNTALGTLVSNNRLETLVLNLVLGTLVRIGGKGHWLTTLV